VWFVPILILVLPMVSRPAIDLVSGPHRPAAISAQERACIQQHEQCVGQCPTDGAEFGDAQGCADWCWTQYEACHAAPPAEDDAAGWSCEDEDDYDPFE
jgi:hypothetical protein